jgi:glutaminyl-tRNA synthetase
LDAENNAENEALGMRKIPFGREIYIEQDDFMENPPPKYFRLTKGAEVRLKHAYFIRCEDVIKNEAGEVVELHCTYDPLTKSGSGFSARKVKGTLHFVSCEHAVSAEFRMFEPLLREESPAGSTLLEQVNPQSMEVLSGYVELGLQHVQPYEKFQFFRHGYFSVDPKWSTQDRAVFNLVVSLKSSFQL